MRKYLLILVCLVGSMVASADEYGYLTFQKYDGLTQSIGIDALEIEYTDGNVIAKNATSTIVISLAELEKMYFSNGASGVEDVKIATDAPVVVYSVAGVQVGEYKSVAQAIEELSAGVYLFKSQDVIQKISVK